MDRINSPSAVHKNSPTKDLEKIERMKQFGMSRDVRDIRDAYNSNAASRMMAGNTTSQPILPN